VQGVHNKRAEEFFGVSQETFFLKKVKQSDEDPAVLFPLRRRRDTASPLLTFGPTKPKTGNQSSHRIHPVGGAPGSNNTGAKTQVQAPRWLVSEKTPFGNHRGDFCHERHVVGGGASDGGQGGGGETIVPGVVDKNTIQADERGAGPHV
jgi:hypothetical protein